MSEPITHMAVSEDAARIALVSDRIAGAFKTSIRNHMDVIRLGGMTRQGDSHTLSFMDYVKENWETRTDEGYVEEKLAFLIGWRGHQAADQRFKGEYRALDRDHYTQNRQSPSDTSIYHDIVVFHEVYGSGKEVPLSPSTLDYRLETHPAFNALEMNSLEKLIVPVQQRQLLELQAYVDDDEGFGKWVGLTVGGGDERRRMQRFRIDMERFYSARNKPSVDRMRRFIAEPNFYNRDDHLIKLARAVQKGEPDSSIDLNGALHAAKDQSQYAQAVMRGYEYIEAASDYFEENIDSDTFLYRSRVGDIHGPRSQQN
jgi:hypothetical protein